MNRKEKKSWFSFYNYVGKLKESIGSMLIILERRNCECICGCKEEREKSKMILFVLVENELRARFGGCTCCLVCNRKGGVWNENKKNKRGVWYVVKKGRTEMGGYLGSKEATR